MITNIEAAKKLIAKLIDEDKVTGEEALVLMSLVIKSESPNQYVSNGGINVRSITGVTDIPTFNQNATFNPNEVITAEYNATNSRDWGEPIG